VLLRRGTYPLQLSEVDREYAGQYVSLGASGGPGFGWHDINVSKTGFDYELAPSLTLRAGYNHGGAPFDGTQAFFNLLAPAVTKDHLHVGGTWTSRTGKEVSFAYIHAFMAP